MSNPKERASQVQQSIRRVLVKEWNPIGLNHLSDTDDEYDSYVGPIYRLLASGSNTDLIIDQLIYFERASMGLPSIANRKADLRPVAEKLLTLDVSL